MAIWTRAVPADFPSDRPVLAYSPGAPFGARLADGTAHIAQRGNGNVPGLWVAGDFYPDTLPTTGARDVTSAEFTHWAEIPTFDGEA